MQIALPARVYITVSERQPVVSWLQDGREVWVDAEKDNITLSMTDRGVTVLFTKEEWIEFQEVIGNIMLEEEKEAEEAP